jgi:hypothetical protein
MSFAIALTNEPWELAAASEPGQTSPLPRPEMPIMLAA